MNYYFLCVDIDNNHIAIVFSTTKKKKKINQSKAMCLRMGKYTMKDGFASLFDLFDIFMGFWGVIVNWFSWIVYICFSFTPCNWCVT